MDGLSSVIDHMRLVHDSPTGLVCPICDKERFVRREQLRFHIQVHNELKRPCEVRKRDTTFLCLICYRVVIVIGVIIKSLDCGHLICQYDLNSK